MNVDSSWLGSWDSTGSSNYYTFTCCLLLLYSLEHRKWQVLQLMAEVIRILERLTVIYKMKFLVSSLLVSLSWLLFLFAINAGWLMIISMIKLGPGDSKSTTVCLLPLVAGLHELVGCYVVDMGTTREFKQCSLANLYISTPDWGLGSRVVKWNSDAVPSY